MGMLPLRWSAAIFLTFFARTCLADEAAALDFSAGFKQLGTLGVPVLPQGTTWAPLPAKLAAIQERGWLGSSIHGHGWMLPMDSDGKRKAVIAGEVKISNLDGDPAGKPGSPGLIDRLLGPGSAGKPNDKPAAADLVKDVRAIQAALEKHAGVKREAYERETVPFSNLLLFAAQIHQAGDPALANSLAQSVLTTAGDKETVVNAAVDALATHQYDVAYQAFSEGRDWAEYHRAVVALLEKFPRGWGNRQAVGMLVEPLAVRAKGSPPSVPALDKITIEPAALESVAWMLEKPPAAESKPSIGRELADQLRDLPAEVRERYLEQMGSRESGLLGDAGDWLLKKPDELAGKSGVAEPTVRLGVGALPVLAALLEDAYFTDFSNPRDESGSYYSSDESESNRILRAYSSLDRPATRGDLARDLLLATLPDPESELGQADLESLRIVALDFWEAHRSDTPDQLALAFCRDGSVSQREEAIQTLSKSADPEVRKSLEALILEAPSPASQLALVKTYLTLRKEEARPFLDRYVKLLREEVSAAGGLDELRGLPYDIREAKSIDPLIRQLEGQVSGKSPQARAREIAKEDAATAAASISALLESLSTAKPRTRFLAMLAGASEAEDTGVRANFLNASFRTLASGDEEAEEEEDPAESADRQIPEGERKIWPSLLADDRKIPESVTQGSTSYGETIGEFAAIALEYSINPGTFETLSESTDITGKTLPQLATERVKARFAGEPIPALPDASKVSKERLAEIVTTAAAKPPLEVHPYLSTLSQDERAAWVGWIRKPNESKEPKEPGSILQLGRIVTARGPAESEVFKDTPGILDLNVGFAVTRDSLQTYLNHLAEGAAGHSRSYLVLNNAPFPPGLTVTATKWVSKPEAKEHPEEPEVEDEEEDPLAHYFASSIYLFKSEGAPANATAVIFASLTNQVAQSNSQYGIWWVIDGKPVLMEANDNIKPVDLPATLAADPDTTSRFQLQIQVLSRADADALKKAE